jgi:hypothetical protein
MEKICGKVLFINFRPKQKNQTKRGQWFAASSDGVNVYVNLAINHSPSSDLAIERTMTKQDFFLVLSYYDRWISGEKGVRSEVRNKSNNTSYIFSLIEYFENSN